MKDPVAVKVWKTSDGEIFPTFRAALIHEEEIELKFKLKEFAEKYGVFTEGKAKLYDAIIENVSELRSILGIEQ